MLDQKGFDLWDEDEEYLVADEIAEMLPEWNVVFLKKSYCSGVVVISK